MSQFKIWMRGTMGWGAAGATARVHPCSDAPRREGIVGFIGNAMGLDKYRDADRLAELDRAVKSIHTEIIRRGEMFCDYQVANGGKSYRYDKNGKRIGGRLWKMEGDTSGDPFVKSVWYRADAEIVVTVVCENEWMDRITDAVLHPKNIPYFGKKCCVGSYKITEVER